MASSGVRKRLHTNLVTIFWTDKLDKKEPWGSSPKHGFERFRVLKSIQWLYLNTRSDCLHCTQLIRQQSKEGCLKVYSVEILIAMRLDLCANGCLIYQMLHVD